MRANCINCEFTNFKTQKCLKTGEGNLHPLGYCSMWVEKPKWVKLEMEKKDEL